MGTTAVFLDRDGTIIEDTGYVASPSEVRLLPEAAEAIRRFSRLSGLVIVVSNQSGVARGLFKETDLSRVHARVEELLKVDGAKLDGAYYCPYLDGPDATVEEYRRSSELRKPKPGMLLQAARDLDIDLSQSWMIGDSERDVIAGTRAGCRTIRLMPGGDGADGDESAATFTAPHLLGAAEIVEREMKRDRPGKAEPPPAGSGEVVQILRTISGQMDDARRQYRQQDFSLPRLFGALAQMFAIVVAIWGFVALLDDQTGSATARLALACFLQLAALTVFVMDRFR